MGKSYSITIDLVSEECCNCHMVFAVPADFHRRAREKGTTFYCPNGHGQSYTETEVMMLKHQLEQKDAALSDTQVRLSEALEVIGKKNTEIRRMRVRIHAGVCPDCQRHFENLERHMKSKHSK